MVRVNRSQSPATQQVVECHRSKFSDVSWTQLRERRFARRETVRDRIAGHARRLPHVVAIAVVLGARVRWPQCCYSRDAQAPDLWWQHRYGLANRNRRCRPTFE